MKILMFGASNYFLKYVIHEVKEYKKNYKFEIIGFIDNDPNKIGKLFCNKPIISINEIEVYKYDYIYISSSYFEEIKKQLIEIGLGDKLFPKSDLEIHIDNIELKNTKLTLKKYWGNLREYSIDLLQDKHCSRFFTNEDKKTSRFVFDLPIEWWSRFYEYSWAAEFVKKGDICLDAACGIEHPLKFYLNKNECRTYACDIDEKILDYNRIYKTCKDVYSDNIELILPQNEISTIKFSQMNLREMNYACDFFDKIFCISVLEHLSQDALKKSMKEFYRIIKPKGKVILTFDYPIIRLSRFMKIVKECGFEFYGKIITEMPKNAIYSDDHKKQRLFCYRALLTK